MILHIGNGKTVRKETIVGIFDLDNASIMRDTRAYLSHATKKKEVGYADSDIPRAFLVLSERQKHKGEKRPAQAVLLSHISSLSLSQRAERPFDEE